MRPLLSIIAGVFVLSGCATDRADRQPTAAAPAEPAPRAAGPERDMQGQMMEMCPMQVEGATVRFEDTADGVALVFTTEGDATDLQQRVSQMAMMYNQHQSQEGMNMRMHGPMEGGPPRGHGMGGEMMMMPPSTARAENIDQGARLVLTPRDPAQLATLRQHAQQMAQAMASRQCPMMERGDRRAGRTPG